jgi:hypothetical protein
MKKLLFGLAAVPFLAGVASAAEPLGDAQMDRVTAGVTTVTCPGPGCSSSTTTVNGVTTSTSSSSGFAIPAGNLSVILQAYTAYLSGKGFTPILP